MMTTTTATTTAMAGTKGLSISAAPCAWHWAAGVRSSIVLEGAGGVARAVGLAAALLAAVNGLWQLWCARLGSARLVSSALLGDSMHLPPCGLGGLSGG